jgi:hypothetical protein
MSSKNYRDLVIATNNALSLSLYSLSSLSIPFRENILQRGQRIEDKESKA